MTTATTRKVRRTSVQVRTDAIGNARTALAKRLLKVRATRDNAAARVCKARANRTVARREFDASEPEGQAMIAFADKRLKAAEQAASKAWDTFREDRTGSPVVNARARVGKAVQDLAAWEAGTIAREAARVEKASAKRRAKQIADGDLLENATTGEHYACATGDVEMGKMIDLFGGKQEMLQALQDAMTAKQAG